MKFTNFLQQDLDVICGIPKHENQKIIRICTMKDCPFQTRLLCGHCLIDHAQHSNSLVPIKDFMEQLVEKHKQKVNYITSKILENNDEQRTDKLKNIVKEQFSDLKKQIMFILDQYEEQFYKQAVELDQLDRNKNGANYEVFVNFNNQDISTMNKNQIDLLLACYWKECLEQPKTVKKSSKKFKENQQKSNNISPDLKVTLKQLIDQYTETLINNLKTANKIIDQQLNQLISIQPEINSKQQITTEINSDNLSINLRQLISPRKFDDGFKQIKDQIKNKQKQILEYQEKLKGLEEIIIDGKQILSKLEKEKLKMKYSYEELQLRQNKLGNKIRKDQQKLQDKAGLVRCEVQFLFDQLEMLERESKSLQETIDSAEIVNENDPDQIKQIKEQGLIKQELLLSEQQKIKVEIEKMSQKKDQIDNEFANETQQVNEKEEVIGKEAEQLNKNIQVIELEIIKEQAAINEAKKKFQLVCQTIDDMSNEISQLTATIKMHQQE